MKFVQKLKRLFRSPHCSDCNRPFNDPVFDVENGTVLCPGCRLEHDPTELYSDEDIVKLSGSVIPDQQEQFLSKLGFKKRVTRRTSKFSLGYLMVIMVIGSLLFAMTIKIHVVLRLLAGLLLAAFWVWQILQYYKDEQIPKWYRETIKN